MRTKIVNFLAGIALATGMMSASAGSASVATVPEGMIAYPITHGVSTMLSLPLTKTESFTSTISAVTSSTIAVADAPAPFTTNLAAPSTPYFVKFLSGAQMGRVLLITSNTTSVLTLDNTDHSTGTPVALNTTGFSVQPGDSFEIFPGDTLASIFGDGTAQNPLVLLGAPGAGAADTVSLYTVANVPPPTYFFNTANNCWQQYGPPQPVNCNNVIIYPYSAFVINRRQNNGDTTLVVSGRVTAVAAQTKLMGQGTVFTSTHFATDVSLSQLNFGPNWTTGSNLVTADSLSVWNAAANRFDTYYQKPDSTWRKYPDAVTDQSNFTIAAGTVTAIAKRGAVAGGATFVHSPLPYSLD